MENTRGISRPMGLIVTVLLTGVIGLVASLAMLFEKLALLENPGAALSCNVSVLIGCSTNLNSEQGALFGFPNPILGLMFWSAVIAAGVGILAAQRLADWFWLLFSLGCTAAMALVVWFVVESIFTLGVLCPWCMLTWAVTIPLFLVVVLHTLGLERMPAAVRRVAAIGTSWVPIITIALYLVIAVPAQLRLDVLSEFI